jgi:hypothetical protein
MTLARLLAAALLLCSLSAFAQDRQAQNSQSSTRLCSKGWPGCVVEGPVLRDKLIFFAWSHYNVATPAEPWRIIPIRPADLSLGQIPPYKPGPPEFEYVRYFGWKIAGPVCYAILGYADPDSMHPAGYTTCQEALRYQSKTETGPNTLR